MVSFAKAVSAQFPRSLPAISVALSAVALIPRALLLSYVKSFLERFSARLTSRVVDAVDHRIGARLVEMRRSLEENNLLQQQILAALQENAASLNGLRDVSRAIFDDTKSARAHLKKIRATAQYQRAFEQSDPLVTVRVATLNAGQLLRDRAIESVLKQTYRNWEMVIVGDGCGDNTEEIVRSIGDRRIKFVNLPHRGIYPEDARLRWLVAGAIPDVSGLPAAEWC